MREELGVFPHNVTSSSALILKDRLFVATSNGVDWSHINIPSPLSPSWIALDKNTGELIGEDGSGASVNALHAAWSSLTYGKIEGQDRLFWGAQTVFYTRMQMKQKRTKKNLMYFHLSGSSIVMSRHTVLIRREEKSLMRLLRDPVN